MAFIVFEGLDGSGKTSLIQGLVRALEASGTSVITTREPGGTPLAEEIRELLIRTTGEAPHPRTELLLYEAGRAQHVENTIKPALARKSWILCDRFTASSVAFQCGGRGISNTDVDWLNHYATAGLQPDLNVLLDLTVEESERRREGRNNATGSQNDRFESEAREFHERVRKSYLSQASGAPTRWLILDSAQKPEALLLALIAYLKEKKWLAS